MLFKYVAKQKMDRRWEHTQTETDGQNMSTERRKQTLAITFSRAIYVSGSRCGRLSRELAIDQDNHDLVRPDQEFGSYSTLQFT
jgi:hypothetical protein